MPGKDEAILALLAKLALHYWRPDFTEGQAKQLYSDYLDDLMPYALKDISDAIREYRGDGKNRFYPTSGQLIDIIIGMADVDPTWTDRAEAIARRRYAATVRGINEAREMQARIEQQSEPNRIESRIHQPQER